MAQFLTRTAGERKLSGGRAFLSFVLAGATALAACGGRAASPAGSVATQVAAPTPSGTSSRFPPVPTNGTPAATGVILPTYFVTILEASYGALTVLTTPASVCTMTVVMPDGSARTDAELRTPRTTDSGGRTTFTYPATPAPAGVGIQTVICEFGGQKEQAQAKFEVK
ncbi:MAG: hypothetical protein NVS9B6_02010 [Candidatus Limnocylindrales bacterium]